MQNRLYIVICWFLVTGCATIVAPSGGPKDMMPPQIIKAEPANYSANFQAEEIEITFNEYVALKDLFNNMIVSPPMEPKPEIFVRGKSILIKIEAELAANTTYNINFGNALIDITEGNSRKNFQYVFSTGTYIDSLSIAGSVIKALDRKPEEEVLVMLYECNPEEVCDSLPYNSKPQYFTRTGKGGSFVIHNIKKSTFKLFALRDENRNYLYDLPNERIAFHDEEIDPADSLNYELLMFEEANPKQNLLKAWSAGVGKLKFAFKQPAGEVRISPINFSAKKSWEIIDYSKNRDTITYWNSFGVDSLLLIIEDEKFNYTDTVKLGLKQEDETRSLSISSDHKDGASLNIDKKITLTCSHPVSVYDLKMVKILEQVDSATFKSIEASVSFDDPALRKIIIAYAWKADGSYRLEIPKAAFTDIFQLQNDTFNLDFNIPEETYYGNAKLDLVVPHIRHTYIIQLINPFDRVVHESLITPKDKLREGLKRLAYNHLVPGKYKIKVIYDFNNNLQWDTGDYLGSQLPERVVFYPEPIVIRSNWDMVLEWDLKE
ncbi:MAG TPA: hypothetical protein EYN89_01750 [Flavobacteriales bacterium]|nr:hypothetical protein [Flavobacteriales bacterium]